MPNDDERFLNGFLILDKPSGLTSRAFVDEIKRLLGVKSAGHVGTLDPNATGVLPVLLGRATRVAPAFERMDKEYVAIVHLHKVVSDAELKAALKAFVGEIKQTPPVKSAVVRKERVRNVYSIEILGRDGKDVRLRIVCEAGTYIRKIASDLGEEIGGAHLKDLRRTKAGPFDEKLVHMLDELKAAVGNNSLLKHIILPIERAVEHLPKVVVEDSVIASVLNGSPIRSGIVSTGGKLEKGKLLAIMSKDGRLVALGRYGPVVKVERVVLKA